ncbi:MAG TPA: methyltransferase domain-containing protein [Jatrophihabitans sp.]|jgi:SAM-dependent methyltransferase|uniref:class I SAM-dependent methyltransferase n=1 Tax=Jatrophihabitans sp. TaxID=1932789 RepID=UPI002F040F31
MSFEVDPAAYGEFIGRYSEPLAAQFATFVGARAGQRALDVGSGPGALTAVLVERLGPQAVVAVDPSASFVSAIRRRLPEVEVQQARAERLPFDDEAFDLVLAQLVVHFMDDPEAGIAEMARVARPGGVVAACVWDHAGGLGPLTVIWRAIRDLDPAARDESGLPGVREGHLVELFGNVGLHPVEQTTLTVSASFADADAWWRPFTLGVGPAGAYVAQLTPDHRESLRARCAQLLPPGPFTVEATAWTAKARV